ncbi:transcription initiation factor iib-2 [Anaeramoeba ignava]|uniref:General transcription factor TFIIB n=1 Tax=Anaeramoeba ignava TaxID=1746090 RepID=A0A9Q0LB49_ANAIG|nr:transcription initiation factor iib-2 [Anaeramoeba ignava]
MDPQKPINEHQYCKQCYSDDIIEDYKTGDWVCRSCGLVLDKVFEEGEESRKFLTDHGTKDRSRVGGPESKFEDDGGLKTAVMITSPTSDNKIAKQHKRFTTTSDKLVGDVLSEIDRIIHRMNLSQSILSHAKELFHNARRMKTIKKKGFQAIAAACVYYALRLDNYPRTFKEICAFSNANKREIQIVYKTMLKNLQKDPRYRPPPPSAEKLMARFCRNLNFNQEITKLCEFVAKQAQLKAIKGAKSPDSVAAGVILLVVRFANLPNDFKKSPDQISEATGVSDGTVRETFREIAPKRAELFPPDFKLIDNEKNLKDDK